MKSAFAAACLLASFTSAFELSNSVSNHYGELQIKENGKDKTVYLTAQAITNGDQVIFPSNNRGTLMTQPEMAPENFYRPKMLGGSISWDIDQSQANCGCINTMYLNSSPGKDESGNYWDTDGQYYCDASATSGNYCPDLDLMEADMYAFQTKPHSCYAPNENGFYSECIQPGDCMLNTVDVLDASAYGPGSDFTIDTTKKYNVKIDIGKSGEFATVLSQDGKSVSMPGNCAGNLQGPLSRGMNIVISQWSTTDNYIWGNSCVPEPCTQQTFTIENLTIETGDREEEAVEHVHGQSDLIYGEYCRDKFADHCNGCDACHWSWVPKYPGSKCRCKPQ